MNEPTYCPRCSGALAQVANVGLKCVECSAVIRTSDSATPQRPPSAQARLEELEQELSARRQVLETGFPAHAERARIEERMRALSQEIDRIKAGA